MAVVTVASLARFRDALVAPGCVVIAMVPREFAAFTTLGRRACG
jgi:hypothetical protein